MKSLRNLAVALALVAPVVLTELPIMGTANATTIATSHISANGGTVAWSVKVASGGWCTWWSSPRLPKFNASVRCFGTAKRSAKIKANTGTKVKNFTLKLTVIGKKTKTVQWMKVAESSKTSSKPTSPTAPSGLSYCIGNSNNCVVTFPAPDDFGMYRLLVGKVYENLPCPDPGVCDLPAGDQLDAVVTAMQAGPSGMSDLAAEMSNFSLILAGGSQARGDSITCDDNVEYALCGLGPEAPGATFGATLYFDAPIGAKWSSVNFRYLAGSITEIYTFHG